MTRKLALAIGAAVLLSGCAPMRFDPGPGMDSSQFSPDNAQCDYIARHGGGTFVAWGSPAYVNSAMTGAAIGNAVRERADYRDCMEAKGWILETGQTQYTATPQPQPDTPNPDPLAQFPRGSTVTADWQLRAYCRDEAGKAALTDPQCQALARETQK